MKMGRRGAALALALAIGAAVAPSGASAEPSDNATCAGQFATSVPGGPIKGDFASENASEDGQRFGEITSTLFARGECDPL